MNCGLFFDQIFRNSKSSKLRPYGIVIHCQALLKMAISELFLSSLHVYLQYRFIYWFFFMMISKEEISLSATDNIFVHHFGHKSDAKSTVVCMYCGNPVIILKNEGQIPRAKRLGKSVLLLNSEAIRHFRYCNETLFTLILSANKQGYQPLCITFTKV